MTAQAVGPTSLAAAAATFESRLNQPCAKHSVMVQGTFTGLTLIMEGSADGATWFPMKLSLASTTGTVTTDVISTTGVFTVPLQVPLTMIRARCTAIATGAALVTLASC